MGLLREEFTNELLVVEEYWSEDQAIPDDPKDMMKRVYDRFFGKKEPSKEEMTSHMNRRRILFHILATQVTGSANAIIRQCQTIAIEVSAKHRRQTEWSISVDHHMGV